MTNSDQQTRIKLTKTVVEKLARPASGQAFVRDTELKGFAVRVTSNGVKSFVIEKRINGRVKRLTLGRYPELTVEQARREAQKTLGKIASGANPIAEKQRERLLSVNLGEAFAEFLKVRQNLKPRTVYDYKRYMRIVFGDWDKKPLISITKDMVARRHAQLGADHGPAYANGSMRLLRSVLNFAEARYEDADGTPLLLVNPVKRLTQTRAWFRVDRRRTVIKPHQLPAFFKAVTALKEGQLISKKEPSPLSEGADPATPTEALIRDDALIRNPTDSSTRDVTSEAPRLDAVNGKRPVNGNSPVNDSDEQDNPLYGQDQTVADYLLLILFTGLRRQEAATLTWNQVDLEGRTLTIPNPKNREPLTLPLSDFVLDLLTARKTDAPSRFVFPGTGKHGYLIEPRNQIQRVIKESKVTFRIHDLRRTFITVAESLDISAYAIKRLVNHKMSGDVTAGYIVSDVERLRRPMQQIADYILRTVNERPDAKVIPLASKQRTMTAKE